MRLQKLLADSGVASRRTAEELITAGRVAVNGVTVTRLGATADPDTDRVFLDGSLVSAAEPKQYLLLYKPRGYLSTARDERGRPTVLDLVRDVKARLYPVGRLDKESEGLLILTNDGDLTLRLTHPHYGVEKEYLVQVSGAITPVVLERLRNGVTLGGSVRKPKLVGLAADPSLPSGSTGLTTGPAGRGGQRAARDDSGQWLRIVLGEGYKREVREMCRDAGLAVRRLVRVRIGTITVERLAPGEHRALTPAEVAGLQGS